MNVREQVHYGEPGDFMTVRHLTIDGTNFEIGRTLGDLAVPQVAGTPGASLEITTVRTTPTPAASV